MAEFRAISGPWQKPLAECRPRRVSLQPAKSARGFSLAETIVATGILATALIGSAFLFALSTRTNMQAKTTTFATVLAQEKMEQLRGLTWGTDEVGLPVSDFTTNLAVDPPLANGTGLTPSPANSLADNVANYVDFVDANGATVAAGTSLYVRRWSIEPLPTNPNNTLVIQVFVFRRGGRPADGADNFIERMPDEARLTTVKTRKAP